MSGRMNGHELHFDRIDVPETVCTGLAEIARACDLALRRRGLYVNRQTMSASWYRQGPGRPKKCVSEARALARMDAEEEEE